MDEVKLLTAEEAKEQCAENKAARIERETKSLLLRVKEGVETSIHDGVSMFFIDLSGEGFIDETISRMVDHLKSLGYGAERTSKTFQGKEGSFIRIGF